MKVEIRESKIKFKYEKKISQKESVQSAKKLSDLNDEKMAESEILDQNYGQNEKDGFENGENIENINDREEKCQKKAEF